MSENIYTVVCPDCDDELFEGSLLEVKNFLKANMLENDAEWDDEDNIVEVLCLECSRSLS